MKIEEFISELESLLEENISVPMNFLLVKDIKDFSQYYKENRDRIFKFDGRVCEGEDFGIMKGEEPEYPNVYLDVYNFKIPRDEESRLFSLQVPYTYFFELGYEFIDCKTSLTIFADLTDKKNGKDRLDFYLAKRYTRQWSKAQIRQIWKETDEALGKNPKPGEF